MSALDRLRLTLTGGLPHAASRLTRLVTVWLLAAFAGVQAAPVEVRDDTGRVLRLEQPPQRIVSLLPSLTEAVCALGACAQLVGVDRYSNWPASVGALPRLGGLDDPGIER